MPNIIGYSLVARPGGPVLAEESAVGGNANLVAHRIVEKLEAGPADTRVSFAQGQQLFHCLMASGIAYLAMADEPLGRRIPFSFLEDVRQRFEGSHRAEAHGAGPLALNDAFAPVLAARMEFFSNDPSADAINRVRAAVADTKGIMVENIEKVLERGERLDLLVLKTDQLSQQAFGFRRETRRLSNQLWWRNVRLTVMIIGALLLILYVVIAITCSPVFHC